MIRRLPLAALLLALAVAPGRAQTTLSLDDAIARAHARNLDARAAGSAERQAAERLTQARAGYRPSVDLTEAWQRGNQPVFVFGSLLAQRQFTAANFAVEALNHPDALDNFRAGAALDQPLFDPSLRAAVRTASAGMDMAAAAREVVAQDLAVAVTGAYGAVLTAEAAATAAETAVASATADLELARNRRDAGVATDADVLQIEVFLARARERQIRAQADTTVGRARLNQLLGEPLDTLFTLTAVATPSTGEPSALASLEAAALAGRPELKVAALQERLADAAVTAARAAFLPRVSAQAGWEANGSAWQSRASSWSVGVAARLNVFRGGADRARLAEARERRTQSGLERERAEAVTRLEVRVALARLEAARAAEGVGQSAAAQAREGHRIIRDRYEGGLADVTALLRAADAVQQADAQEAAARIEVVVAAATLARATGTK